jgi:hypothetical protein
LALAMIIWFIWRVETITRIRLFVSRNEKSFRRGTNAAVTNEDVAVWTFVKDTTKGARQP